MNKQQRIDDRAESLQEILAEGGTVSVTTKMVLHDGAVDAKVTYKWEDVSILAHEMGMDIEIRKLFNKEKNILSEVLEMALVKLSNQIAEEQIQNEDKL